MEPESTEIRVLVVDDEELLTKIIERHLVSEGSFITCIERDSTHAAQKALEFMPHIILLDIVMPEMDGHAVAHAIKANAKTKHIPILHISAMASARCGIGQLSKTEEGFFLAKPFLRKDLLEAIRVTLTASEGPETD